MNSVISTYIWPGQTHVGFGAVVLVGQEAVARQAQRVFILADPGVIAAGLVEPLTAALDAVRVSHLIYNRIVPNPDAESVDAAGQAYRESGADLIVGLGGGSALDTAKAVRLLAGGPPEARITEYGLMLGDKARPAPQSHQLPAMLAIPTTAGTGSEVTPWAVITDHTLNRKFGIGGSFLVPTAAIIDPQLMLTLPPLLTAATGLDALTHCIEAFVSTNHNPALDGMILQGIELISRSLRLAVAQSANRQARHDMALGALIGGIAISSNWLGACHSLSHQLSSLANVQHGIANALMLPHQMAYSLPGAVERYARIGAALDAPHPLQGTLRQQAGRAVEAVRELVQDIDLPTRLRDVGVTEALIPLLAKNAYNFDSNWQTNPRLIDETILERLYREAF